MQELLKTLDGCGLRYGTLELGDGLELVVTQYGGHVFGPFSGRYPEGVFWMPDSVKDPPRYQKLVDSRSWNIGGDRVWVAPEIQFNITDRKRFRETLDTPKIIDPGDFSMKCSREAVVLRQSMDLESRNTVTGTIRLDFERTILRALNPLRKLPDYDILMQGVSYCGFEQVLDLTADSRQDMYAESWDLLQIRPEGVLYIPMYRPLRGTGGIPFTYIMMTGLQADLPRWNATCRPLDAPRA